MKLKIKKWTAVAAWHWTANDETCGICRMQFDGCCPDCKVPGDDCPLVWGKCTHVFHMHCILKWLNSQQMQQLCPMCRQDWQFNDWRFVIEFWSHGKMQVVDLTFLKSQFDGTSTHDSKGATDFQLWQEWIVCVRQWTVTCNSIMCMIFSSCLTRFWTCKFWIYVFMFLLVICAMFDEKI